MKKQQMQNNDTTQVCWSGETYSKTAGGESFVTRQEVLNSSVVVVRDGHPTQCLIAAFDAELALTVAHHSDDVPHVNHVKQQQIHK